MTVVSNELTGELCQQRPHAQVSGTGRYFIDLLLKELEKSSAFLGNTKESGDTSQRCNENFEFPRKQ